MKIKYLKHLDYIKHETSVIYIELSATLRLRSSNKNKASEVNALSHYAQHETFAADNLNSLMNRSIRCPDS